MNNRTRTRRQHMVSQAADLLVRYPFAAWFYGDAIGFEALLAASDLVNEHYHHVPTGFLVPWGQGPLILAASWREGRERREEDRAHENH